MLFRSGEFAGLDEVALKQGRHPEQPVTHEALRALGMTAHLVNLLSAIVRVAPFDEKTLEPMAASIDFSRLTGGNET